MPRPYRILEIVADVSSCSWYRNVLPTLRCKEELARHNIEITNQQIITNEPEEMYDCYVWSRIPHPLMLTFIYRSMKRGCKLIWDLDDELWNVPGHNHAFHSTDHHMLETLNFYLDIASHVITSTENLARSLCDKYKYPAKKVTVLENLVQQASYKLKIDNELNVEPTKIIWSGGDSHKKDVQIIMSLHDHFLYDKNVILIMFGYIPEEFYQLSEDKLVFVPWCNRKYYESILSVLAPHVALVPLEDTQFNRCKSAIKYYEMALAGVPISTRSSSASIRWNCRKPAGRIRSTRRISRTSGNLGSSDKRQFSA